MLENDEIVSIHINMSKKQEKQCYKIKIKDILTDPKTMIKGLNKRWNKTRKAHKLFNK